MVDRRDMQNITCDVLIIGAGAAGVAAGVTASRQGLNVVMVKRYGFCGGERSRGYPKLFADFISLGPQSCLGVAARQVRSGTLENS